MQLADIKPQSKSLVYDLVTQAGVDTSDWVNYRRPESPASNPNYCYNWSFEGLDRVVVCLWFEEMKFDGEAIAQILNYRSIAASRQHWNPTQRKRAANMDHAIQLANNKRLPIRVIVVDGSMRADDDNESRSHVKRRMLDPEVWHVAAYDDDGTCRLQRGPWPSIESTSRLNEGSILGRRLARIAFNSAGWQHPTGDAGELESGGTYNAKNRFGHEDWLFRAEWIIDGWRYAFIQGFNKPRLTYVGQPLDVMLYTLQPDKRRRLVATINALESLDDTQAKDALEAFKMRGWLSTMQREIQAIGGNADALGDPQWAEHVLNVRYRLENVDVYPPDMFLPDDEWIRDRRRYMLYKLESAEQDRIEHSLPERGGSQDLPTIRQLFRRGTKPLEYTPEHGKMQAKLMAELQLEFGKECVTREKDFVDVRVETKQEVIYFEIKTDLDPRAAIRQALGQILEYAYHPTHTGRRPNKLVIVGRVDLSDGEARYLETLRKQFGLPVGYRVISLK